MRSVPLPRARCAGRGAAQRVPVLHAGPQTDSTGAEQESGTGTLGIVAALAKMCALSQARECAGGESFQVLLWGRVTFSGIHLSPLTGETVSFTHY